MYDHVDHFDMNTVENDQIFSKLFHFSKKSSTFKDFNPGFSNLGVWTGSGSAYKNMIRIRPKYPYQAGSGSGALIYTKNSRVRGGVTVPPSKQ